MSLEHIQTSWNDLFMNYHLHLTPNTIFTPNVYPTYYLTLYVRALPIWPSFNCILPYSLCASEVLSGQMLLLFISSVVIPDIPWDLHGPLSQHHPTPPSPPPASVSHPGTAKHTHTPTTIVKLC